VVNQVSTLKASHKRTIATDVTVKFGFCHASLKNMFRIKKISCCCFAESASVNYKEFVFPIGVCSWSSFSAFEKEISF